MVDNVSNFRPDDDRAVGEMINEMRRELRALTGRATSGRVAGPIVLSAVPNGDGTYTVSLVNEQTGNTVTVATAL